MTVEAKAPIVEYTGNGVIVSFEWTWEMLDPDSSIEVLVNDVPVTSGWELQGNYVVFDTAPADGDFIQIYRRTRLWMPENFRAFGRFYAEQTELSMDRAMLIAQERQGNATPLEPANGIVGRSGVRVEYEQYQTTLVSERGTDAVIGMWQGVDEVSPDEPHPSIIWDEWVTPVFANAFGSGGSSCFCTFSLDLGGYSPNTAAVFFPVNNNTGVNDWVDVDPDDGDYWMRVTSLDGNTENLIIVGAGGFSGQVLGQPFQIAGGNGDGTGLGAQIIVDTYSDPAGTTRVALLNVEICRDSNGQPDNRWASRTVRLESANNV